jgi:pimeloyl-ACP methyl ester carboxylesterase
MILQVNNHEVYYGTGSGRWNSDGKTIVFIHGAAFDHSIWVMPARYFARHGYNVIALDLPGHGQSSGELLTTIDSMSDWIVDVISAVVGDANASATVVGHSMGSLIAMNMAARYKATVEQIALLGTSAPMPVTHLLLDAAKDNHHAAIDMTNTWSHSQRSILGVSDNPGVSNMHAGERWLERAGESVLYTDLAACDAFDATKLPAVKCPALVITGGDDKMTPPKAGNAVAQMLPNAHIKNLPGCGHSMLTEQPNQTLDALADFILT